MRRKQDYYEHRTLARLYDWQHRELVEDISFFVELAKQHGSPVLEVGCGTGRVIIPLAREGIRVVGVDLSSHMLAIARRKIDDEAAEVRERIELQQGDMRDFSLGREFPCVFVPQAAVFHLDGQEAVRGSFRNFHEHTKPGGVILVDVVSPDRMKNQEVGREVMVGERIAPETGLRNRELNEKLYIDRERQVVCCKHSFIVGEGDRERRIEVQQKYRWLEEQEAVALFREVGCREVTVFGDYDRSPFGESSPRLILLARKDEGNV